MCPVCVTTLALIAAGTGSAGGLAAVVARKIRAKPGAKSEELEVGDLPPAPARLRGDGPGKAVPERRADLNKPDELVGL